MGWPQIAVITICAMGIGISLEQHGKPKEGVENVWTTIIATAVFMALLWAGGFFGGGK